MEIENCELIRTSREDNGSDAIANAISCIKLYYLIDARVVERLLMGVEKEVVKSLVLGGRYTCKLALREQNKESGIYFQTMQFIYGR